MKKLIAVLILIMITIVDSYGQWYSKKYIVTDINLLTKEQMETLMRDQSGNILAAGVVAGVGGLMIWGGRSTLKNGFDDDVTFLEDLLGPEFLGKTYIIFGITTIACGTVAGVLFFIRHEIMRSALSRNYGHEATLSISPSVITTRITRSSALGLTVSVNF